MCGGIKKASGIKSKLYFSTPLILSKWNVRSCLLVHFIFFPTLKSPLYSFIEAEAIWSKIRHIMCYFISSLLLQIAKQPWLNSVQESSLHSSLSSPFYFLGKGFTSLRKPLFNFVVGSTSHSSFDTIRYLSMDFELFPQTELCVLIIWQTHICLPELQKLDLKWNKQCLGVKVW